MIRIEVTAQRPVTLEELKAATDGLLAAAHWMPRATVPDTEKFRVRLRAAGIATSPDQVTVCSATRLARPSGRANA